MGQLAYLAPVGPFAGLSKTAQNTIHTRFPTLCFAEVQSAAERFCLDLQAEATEQRLAEAREMLNAFAAELSRMQRAVDRIREHCLADVLGEAGRMISGENEFERLNRSLNGLRIASQRTSKALPGGLAQRASRNLVGTLAGYTDQARLPRDGIGIASLVSLVHLIFEDLMIGAEAKSAVADWQKCQTDCDRIGILTELVICCRHPSSYTSASTVNQDNGAVWGR